MDKPKTCRNYIRGEWLESRSGNVMEVRNPAATDEVLAIFPRSGEEDVAQAVEAASEALPHWRRTPAPKRAEILFRVAQILEERKEFFATEMTREMGKVLKESRGDVQEAIDMAWFMAGEGRRLYGQTTPSELANKFAMSLREPVGVCGMITPWNFPMAIPSWKIFPAMICGNTVVIKPAEDTPLSCYHLIQALAEAGLPRGVVNLVAGVGEEVGAALVNHPGVHLISFTGSTETGRQVSMTCASGMKRCHLEMGGKNVIIILEDANLDLALQGALWGAFGTSGQRCTAASRIVVHNHVYEEFLDRFIGSTEKLRVGNGLDPGTHLGPIINRAQLSKVQQYVQIGLQEGARLVFGGHTLNGPEHAGGIFHEPTIFCEVTPQMRIAQEEIFGPVASVIRCDGLESAIAIGNNVSYGLSASIYTSDIQRAFHAMREMNTGIFYVNAPTIGAEIHLPFGGTKGSGNGHREAGVAALEVYSEWKAVYIDYSGRLQKAQISD